MFYLEAEQYFLNWEFLFNQLKVSFYFSPSLKRLQWSILDSWSQIGLFEYFLERQILAELNDMVHNNMYIVVL